LSPAGSDPDLLRRMARDIQRKRDIEQGLGVARRRQAVMLPSMPEIDGYEFACTYDPAADISGDFYDFVRLGDDRVGILMGDVSGHGIEAAIVMGMAKKSLSIFARFASGPADALSQGNDDLCGDLDSDSFLTAAYAVLDGPGGQMVLARAGHPMPVLFNRKRKPRHEEIRSKGMMVGMSKGATFGNALEEVTVELVPGDLMFFYTDGLTEARSPSGAQFGLDRSLEILESSPRAKVATLLENVRSAVADFRGGGEPEDDITMMAVRRNA
jgi:sigma-B regulation protein RsbU (phosphoserine phosphatase)